MSNKVQETLARKGTQRTNCHLIAHDLRTPIGIEVGQLVGPSKLLFPPDNGRFSGVFGKHISSFTVAPSS